MGYTTLNKDEKEEEKKVLILFTPTFLPFGQEVSLAQRARSIPICKTHSFLPRHSIPHFMCLCDNIYCFFRYELIFSTVTSG